MSVKKFYVYSWTHKPTGKHYISKRYAKDAHSDEYWITSNSIMNHIILCNIQDWSRSILFTSDDTQEVHDQLDAIKSEYMPDQLFEIPSEHNYHAGWSTCFIREWFNNITEETFFHVNCYIYAHPDVPVGMPNTPNYLPSIERNKVNGAPNEWENIIYQVGPSDVIVNSVKALKSKGCHVVGTWPVY